MVFGSKVSNLTLLETKYHTGEARSASAALSLAEAALLLSGDLDKDKGYKILNGKVVDALVEGKNMKNVLAIAYAFGGTYTAVIITK